MKNHRWPSFRALAVFAMVAAAALAVPAGCTMVVGAKPDGGDKVVIIDEPPPPPSPLQANVLYVVNLHRSTANLATHYATFIQNLHAELADLGLLAVGWAVAPTYAGPEGPRLLLGSRSGILLPSARATTGTAPAPARDGGVMGGSGGIGGTEFPATPPPGSDGRGGVAVGAGGDLAGALRSLAASGLYDGDGELNEARNVIAIGRGLDRAPLPPGAGGIEHDAFFDRPRDMFLVVYIQSLRRRCGLADSACAVDGRPAGDILTEVDGQGNAAWPRFVGGLARANRVVHVTVGTAEGVAPMKFREQCSNRPSMGFPENLYDMIEPSPAVYFTPLTAALNARAPGTGQAADLCDVLPGYLPEPVQALAVRIAAQLASPASK